MKLNRWSVSGLMYITFWVSATIATIGNVSESCGEPSEWYLPLLMLAVIGFPFVLGYLGGRDR